MQVVDKIDLAAMALNELVANKRHVSSFLDRSEDVQALCNAVLTDDETSQIQIIDSIIENGITIKEVYECFIPEAAALLGIYWEESRISFSEVSLGSQRLQKLASIREKLFGQFLFLWARTGGDVGITRGRTTYARFGISCWNVQKKGSKPKSFNWQTFRRSPR